MIPHPAGSSLRWCAGRPVQPAQRGLSCGVLVHARRWFRTARPKSFSSVTHDVTSSVKLDAQAPPSLPALRCPGGPRLRAEGLKHLYKVPHAGYLAKYGHRFVLNLKLTHQIVSYLSRTTLKTSDKVLVELGPGAGSLTRSLLTRPCVGVLGVEVDPRFNPHLEQIRAYTQGKFAWVNADVLKLDEVAQLQAVFPDFVAHHQHKTKGDTARDEWVDHETPPSAPLRSRARDRLLRNRERRRGGGSRLSAETMHRARDDSSRHTSPNPAFDIADHWWADGDAKVEVIANLPFDIITELLMRYAVDCSRHQGLFSFGRVPLHIFTQREIAERIMASSGSMHFSRLSVLCQSYFHVRLKQTFTEMTYYPKTEVQGAMLTLEPRSVPLAHGLDGAVLIHFTNHLMKPGHRGHTVHKALNSFVPPEVVQYMLQEVRMDGAMTVLDLSVDEVTQLAELWHRFLQASSQQTEAHSQHQQQQQDR